MRPVSITNPNQYLDQQIHFKDNSMAQVVPFSGILYNPKTVSVMADVTAPPYDVISSDYQNQLYERHPYNIVRLILTKDRPEDAGEADRHRRAGQTYLKWRAEEILVRDQTSAFYLQETAFTHENRQYRRLGLIARVRLEAFEAGIILPHEKTFSKVKSERLGLMRHCHANFSPIFALYADSGAIIKTLKTAAQSTSPFIAMTDDQGHRHRLHRVVEPEILKQLETAFDTERLYIADGHHRYETALNYRAWVAANDPDFGPDHPANYVLMYLASMQDPGMNILPAHRLLHQVPVQAVADALTKAEPHFEMETFSAPEGPADALTSRFLERLRAQSDVNAIGLVHKDRPELTLLRLKPGAMQRLYAQEMAAELLDLDVSVLTRLIFMDLLGFDQARLDNNQLIGYSSSAREAVAAVQSGAYDAGFILNPTRMHQVRSVSEAGLVMPRKSTYFFPKVTSGLVQNSLVPED
jgi:uncharacterized protein (DUF1015 family)